MVTLVEALQEKGSHSIVWEGRDSRGAALPSGVYLCTLESATETQSKKFVLAR